MEPITKQECELLITEGILKCVHGRYPGLTITSKRKKGNGKQRQLDPDTYKKLLRLQEKLKVDATK